MARIGENVFGVAAEDPELEAAAAKARKTFRYLYRELAWERRRIVPGLELAAVKAKFSDPPEVRSTDPDALEVEYMWLLDVDFNGKEISGTLINSPHSLVSVKEGDRVTVSGKQMYDWMYSQLGQVYGGFTVDAMRSKMPKGERKQHDDAWGFDFGDPGIVNVVPAGYIGEEEPKKGWFKKSKQTQQDFQKVAQFEHPMSDNMRSSLDEAIAEDPQFLTQTDQHGYNMLHQLALAGSAAGVEVCLKHGANPAEAAPNGMTPFALAKSLGWTRVMALLPESIK